MTGLDLDLLREVSARRRDRWHTPDTEPWTGADWGNAMGGECGEAQNVVKKLRRIETRTGSAGDPPREVLIEMLGDELADTIAYADLLADHYGIDLSDAIARKFNAISEREGFPDRLPRREELRPNPRNLAEVECLTGSPHDEHEWSSLTHTWWCPGVRRVSA